ncbi:hypothetical protein A5724_07665 [Mycobacterium sp. ACS1612]|uniref:hypothetical protein n=1 Tax=Mycobacterium sp. ACS1612 TaxID=1834117 RepID=UPI000801935A|nr:hypothetical protein [Mycobacterium sp. ACS1612]OBF40643.1 hypothetical protein A5724_07665 [Mycobacterium sp. ACS1612]
MRASTVARLQGVFNIVGGLWPLVHMRSFESVLGPKTDRWLVYTVAGLMVSIGGSQLSAASQETTARHARFVGAGAASTFAAIDVIYVMRRRISRMYLLDALMEAGWLAAWAVSARRSIR